MSNSFVCILLTASYAISAQERSKADLVLRGVITRSDYHTYREVPFRVPEGIGRLTVEFSYTGREQRTTIDLGIFDGERFRGWSGGNKIVGFARQIIECIAQEVDVTALPDCLR